MSVAMNYPFPDSFPPDKLKRLVESRDFEFFQEMLMARAAARQAQLVACDAGFDVMRQIQGGIREDLWLANLPDLVSELEQGRETALSQEGRKAGAHRDIFGEKPSAPRANPLK